MELTKDILKKILEKYPDCYYCKHRIEGEYRCNTIWNPCFEFDETLLKNIIKELEGD